MKKIFIILIILLWGCNSNDPVSSNDQITTTNDSPYFTYKIGTANAVTVNCEHIKFESNYGGDHIEPILATSQSTRSTFSYAFYGSSSSMDSVKVGRHPLISYSAFASTVPMHFSLKAPRTTGSNDFYFAVNSDSQNYYHNITSIEKKNLENGKRVYLVHGSYKLKAQNIVDNEIADIEGKYFFKLLTVEE